ncbi:MAG: class I SAM-dependent methyltransferase [Bacteroidales bacterium]|nr:class I SAM-dependent methyltransferase [Bacteroidales bacterium]
MLRRKHRLVSEVTRKVSGTLLDIGSGTGYFASFMQLQGWKVTGIELNEQARNYSVTGLGITAIPPADAWNIPDKSIDCITFWHVIEHLYDPGRWMSEVKRILKDDGSCIIALPNLNSADAEWFGGQWAALDVPRHLWHFSPHSLIRFIGKYGFNCEKTRSLPLDIFYISTLSYKNLGRRLSLLRGILTGTFLTAVSLFRKNRASSLIYVTSKQGS